jgi:hypothetical protein
MPPSKLSKVSVTRASDVKSDFCQLGFTLRQVFPFRGEHFGLSVT